MKKREDILSAIKSYFPYALDFVPFYRGGFGQYPGYHQQAVIVPIDGDYVVQRPRSRNPISWLENILLSDVKSFRRFVELMEEHGRFEDIAGAETDGITPYLPNGFFGHTDASALTAMIAHYRPKRYVEIGSGHSTRFARRAVNLYGTRTKITCIDPNPRSQVAAVSDQWIQESLLDVDLDFFKQIDSEDILMLDGSHLVFHGTDTTHFFMHVLPVLKRGVIVHIHDIFLPYEYPERCDALFWNEQYLLASFLQGNDSVQVLAPIQFMNNQGLCQEGVSFWLKI